MEIRVLGPVEVWEGDASCPIKGVKERVLLAALALRAGQLVTLSSIRDVLWGDAPPRTADKALQNYVVHLRHALGRDAIKTELNGYRLRLAEGAVDIEQFELLVTRGRRSWQEGDAAATAAALHRALGLWRGDGPDLGDTPAARAARSELFELRMAVLEERVEADLALGRHGDLVAELEGLVARHPFREHLWGQLMVAQYRGGRQADALRAYQRARTVLVHELGVEPSPELRELEARVIRQDANLARPIGVTTTTATFLFTDIVASTQLWEQSPDAMRATVRRHDELLEAAVAAHGGEIFKRTGDGIVAAFASASDALGAAAQAQLSLAAAAWPETGPPAVRMAVYTGPAEQRDGDWFGPALNRCARLLGGAHGGQVVVGAITRHRADGVAPEGASLRHVGDYVLRGVAEPQPVYQLVLGGLRSKFPPLQLAPEGEVRELPVPDALSVAAAGPFVGRGVELRRLCAAWEAARETGLRVIFVGGEPGVGKTRLLAELATVAASGGATVLFGRCDEEALGPFQPAVEALRGYVGAGPIGILRAVSPPHAAELARLVPDLTRRLPDLPVPPPLGAEGERHRLFDAAAALLHHAAGDRPVLLVLDDLHWADRPTLQLVRHLARSLGRARMLIVGAYRDTELGRTQPLSSTLADLLQEPSTDRVDLHGIEEQAVVELLETTAGNGLGDQAVALAHAIQRETEGNPLFVTMVVRDLVESGNVVLREGRWTSAGAIGDLRIPQGVRDVIGQRLARLLPGTNEVLAVASIVGRQFDLPVIATVTGFDENEVLAALEEALSARLVEEVADIPDRYSFTHDVIRSTLYGEPSTSRRLRLHHQVALAIEENFAARLDDHVVALAFHYREAAAVANAGKAVEYCRRAGDRSMVELAFESAAGYYREGIEALELEPDDARRAELLLALGEALDKSGDPDASRAAFLAAADLGRILQRPDGFARAALGLAGTRISPEPTDEAGTLLLEALGALGADDDVLRVMVLSRLVLRQGAFDPPDALARTVEAEGMAARLADPASRLAAVLARLQVSPFYGDPSEEVWLAEEAARLATTERRAGDLVLAKAHQWIAALRGGEPLRAWQHFDDYVRLADDSRIALWAWSAACARGTRASLEGRFDDAEPLIGYALTAGSKVYVDAPAQAGIVSVYATQIAALRFLQRRFPELLPLIDAQVVQFPMLTTWPAAQALAYAQTGRRDEAARLLREVTGALGAPQTPPTRAALAWNLAHACFEVGDTQVAEQLLSHLRPLVDRNCVFSLYLFLGSYSHLVGLLEGVVGNIDEARRQFEDAATRYRDLGATAWLNVLEDNVSRLVSG